MDFKKNKIVIIGAGKIAFSLTAALCNAGIKPAMIISRKLSSARILAQKFSINAFSDSVRDIPQQPVTLMFSVPDNELSFISLQIAKQKINFKKSVFIHLSGSQDINSLSDISLKEGNTGSFHLMQTFPSKKIRNVSGAYVGIEYENEDVKEYLFYICKALKLKPIEIPKGGKTAYHLTGVFISNFYVANFFSAQEVFSETGLIDVKLSEMLEPLLKATIQNVKKAGVFNAISGPVERGDIKTIKAHIDILNNYWKQNKISINVLVSYLSQSLTIIRLLEQKNSPLSEKQEELSELLKTELLKLVNLL